MKILFSASLTGKKHYLKNYRKIVEVLENNGYEVFSGHMFSKNRLEVEQESIEERQKYQQKLKLWISQAELLVVEVSFPSTAVGYQITYALDKGKPVLALHVEEKIPVTLIGESSEKLTFIPYKLEELDKILPKYIGDAREQMDVRFNFFISPKIGAYLDWIAKHRKLPRAVFLRRLIEEHMTKNKEYNKA